MQSRSDKIYQAFAIIVVVAITISSIFPLLYVVSMSLVNEQEWLEKGGFILWPAEPTLLAYERILQGASYIKALGASTVRTIVGTAITLAMTFITAYIVSRKNLPGRNIILFFVLLTILINGGLIPTYLTVRGTGMLDSLWALIIPGMIDSWSVLVLKQFFEGVPRELEESATIDGAGEVTLMTSIMIPMAKPALAAIGLFIAVAHWNAWFDALIYLRNHSPWQPVQLLIRNMFINPDLGSQLNNANLVGSSVYNPSNRVSLESLKMAAVVFGTLPILCVYPFLQKHFIKGMYIGSVKG